MAVSFAKFFGVGNPGSTGLATPQAGGIRQSIVEMRLQERDAFGAAQRGLSRADRRVLQGMNSLGDLDGTVSRLKSMTPLQRATRIVGRTLLLGALGFGGIETSGYFFKKSHMDDYMAAMVFDDPQVKREIELRQMIQTRPELSKSIKQIFNADAAEWAAALNQRIQNPTNIPEELEARVLLKIVQADLPVGNSAQDILDWLNAVDTNELVASSLAKLTGMDVLKISEVARERLRAAELAEAIKNFEKDYLQKIPAEYRELFKDQFVVIAPGTFMMGSDKGEDDEKPVHAVTITAPFAMQKYEMSQRLYQALWGDLPSDLPEKYRGADLPVVRVNWQGSQGTCKKIGGRLPTEAEWEMVASNYGKAEYALPDGVKEISKQYANVESYGPVAVKSFQPNPLGVFNLSGNVWEWGENDYAPNLDDGRGFGNGIKVIRGGSWRNASRVSRASNRDGYHPDGVYYGVGFRCVLPQDSDL